MITKNTYDELGQLISKNVGGTDTIGASGLQTVDYNYSIRGWLKNINDVNNIGTDLFSFKINYDDYQSLGSNDLQPEALYNGNISATYWKTKYSSLKKYNYEYDNLNRLTEAVYLKPELSINDINAYNEILSYDKNGNIQTLERNGGINAGLPNPIDDLAYTYDTNNKNLLVKVADASTSPQGFKNGSNTGNDYVYDANGNMTIDNNKGIRKIVYNHLNLPTEITFVGTDKISYIYNATGQKVAKVVTENSIITKTHYLAGGFQYKNNALQFFPHAEGGYVKKEANNYSYVFNYTDHLGNIRLSYTDIDNNGTIDIDEIVEENEYYPFGLKHESHISSNVYQMKYNGKELQTELGLNMYDYGARNYDPALGRWMNMDPYSEKYVGLSPYAFAANSPILLTDPDGRDIVFSWQRDDDGKIIGINIDITGKVIDDTKNKKLSEKQLQKYKDRIIKGLTENIKSEDENFSINVTANIDIAQSEDDLSETDHAFRITDEIKKKAGHTDPNVDVDGFSVKGENFVYLDKNFMERTVAHEIGHSAGLDHIKEEKKNGEHGKPTDFLGFSSTGYRHYRFYTTNFYPGNLMHQSLDPNPGNTLTRWQFNKMMSLYDTKQLNKGKQKVD